MRMNFRKSAGACLVALVVAGFGTLVQATEDNDSGLWFVELNGSVATFRGQALASGVDFSERYVYRRVWKGLSVRTSADGASVLKRLPAVKAVFPVLKVDLAPVETVSPELIHALAMTGADVAQSELGLTGEGVKVAVMDTGVDYHHPDLGGGFGRGQRVVTGYDFVGDRFDSGGSGGALIPHPDADPDDCNGHGTHVAGIIGASGNPETGGARGVAPGVTFGAYRVFGCDGSTDADIMVAAMERALEDGMDVLNMSIGAAFQTWPQYPTAVAADTLVDAGMIVVTSIGNSGASGVYSAGAPGVGRKVIGVASFDNTHLEMPTFVANARPFGYVEATAAAPTPTAGTRPLVRTGTTTSTADGCSVAQADGALASPFAQGSLAGKIALIRRGTCSFYEKSRNAEMAGAVGVVLYNNAAGFINPTVAAPAGSPAITIPVVAVLSTDGAELTGKLPNPLTSSIDLTWSDQRHIFANPTAGTSSSFTSYGLNAELQLKPNVGAPGGLIRSTYPLERGGYATISGTSMASPHVAGAVALFLEKRPGASRVDVQTAIQNSADPVVIFGTTVRDAVHRQGAGMLDIDDAIGATSTVTPSELTLGEGNGTHTRVLTITNKNAAPVTYTLSHQSAAGTRGSTFAPILTTNTANVAFTPSSVVLEPGATGTVTVTITPTLSVTNPTTGAVTSFDRSVYSGYIAVSGGDSTYRVPYAGFTGDYQSIQVLASGGCSFPGIFKRGGETECAAATPTAPAAMLANFTRQAEAATFNVEDRTDRPVILYHRAHQSRRLEIRALDVATNQSYLVAFSDYVSRNATNGRSFTDGGFSTYTWDGKRLFTNASGRVRRMELPAGLYKLQVVVTKALAEDGNTAHVETWTSPTINISRN
jgi:minor extracellular serine protease Vpr